MATKDGASVGRVDVLVVGGGPVGLAAGLGLYSHGVACLVVDRKPPLELGGHPKAKFVNLRTMQIMRRLGLAGALRSAAPIPPEYPSNVHHLRSLLDAPFRSLLRAFPTATEDTHHLSPEPALRIPQPHLEAVLAKHLADRSGAVQFNTEVVQLEQEADGITAVLEDVATRRRWRVHASYVIGADGVGSFVRDKAGIRLQGDRCIAKSVGTVFRAPDLHRQMAAGPGVHYWVVRDDLPATVGFGPLDLGGTWFFEAMGLDEHRPEVTASQIIQRATKNQVTFEIANTSPWKVRHLRAERYQSGRILLVGDAIHVHAPTGGFGMNMGIADAYDLAWKLAGVVAGWAPTSLLGSFQVERGPVHAATMARARQHFASLDMRGAKPDRTPIAEPPSAESIAYHDSIDLQLGTSYEASPWIVADSSVQHSGWSPGALVPNAWLSDGGSLLDRLASGFTLLTSANAAGVRDFVAAAGRAEVPLRHVLAPVELCLPSGYSVLVRPDGHVAWCGYELEAPRVLRTVLYGLPHK